MPERVATEHEGANAAIDTLRQIAIALKEVGDENIELESKLESQKDEFEEALETAEKNVAAAERVADDVRTVVEAVQDYERGILDRGELFAKVREVKVEDD